MTLLYKTICVLVSGPQMSGKSTFSRLLASYLHTEYRLNANVFLFAGEIKRLAMHLGWDGVKDEKGRRFLQDLGMAGRAYDENLWTSYLIDRHIPSQSQYPFDVIIIDDWRFENERSYIEKNILYDVHALRLVREEGVIHDDHISEHSLPDEKDGQNYYRGIIYNTGDLYALERSAVAVSEFIFDKYNKGENIKC